MENAEIIQPVAQSAAAHLEAEKADIAAKEHSAGQRGNGRAARAHRGLLAARGATR